MVSAETLTDICNDIAEGKSLRSICRERELSESSVRRWLAANDDAMAHSARARELGCDALADECLEIADEKLPDAVAIAAARMRIDTRLRLIGKWSQRYSDKLMVKSEKTVTHRYDLDSIATERLEQLESILADAQRGASGAGETQPSSVH